MTLLCYCIWVEPLLEMERETEGRPTVSKRRFQYPFPTISVLARIIAAADIFLVFFLNMLQFVVLLMR